MYAERIAEYFRPSLSYHLSLRSIVFEWPFYKYLYYLKSYFYLQCLYVHTNVRARVRIVHACEHISVFYSSICSSVRLSVPLYHIIFASVRLSVCKRLMQVSLCVPSSFRESICLIFRPYVHVRMSVCTYACQTDRRSFERWYRSLVGTTYIQTGGHTNGHNISQMDGLKLEGHT